MRAPLTGATPLCNFLESKIINLFLFLKFNKVLNRKIWCALSTHENEEYLFGNTHIKIKKTIIWPIN